MKKCRITAASSLNTELLCFNTRPPYSHISIIRPCLNNVLLLSKSSDFSVHLLRELRSFRCRLNYLQADERNHCSHSLDPTEHRYGSSCFHVCCNWRDCCVKRASEQSQRNLWVTMLQRASQMMLGSEESTRMLIWGSLAHMTNMRFCREKISQEMGNFYLEGAPHLVLFLIMLTDVSTVRGFFWSYYDIFFCFHLCSSIKYQKYLRSTHRYSVGYFKGALHRFYTWWLLYLS